MTSSKLNRSTKRGKQRPPSRPESFAEFFLSLFFKLETEKKNYHNSCCFEDFQPIQHMRYLKQLHDFDISGKFYFPPSKIT